MGNSKFHISTYAKWFISYVMVLILPFLFGCGIYAFALDSVRAEVDSIQELNLHQTGSLVENTIMDARNISEALLSDENVILLMNLMPEANYSEANLVKNISETIENYETANQLISSIYICMEEKEYVISNSAYYRYDWVKTSAQSFFGVSYEEFERLVQQENDNHFVLTGSGEDVGAYYVHSSYRYQEGNLAPVVVFIRYKADVLAELVTSEDYLTSIWQSEESYLLSDGSWPEEAGELVTQVLAGENQDYYLMQSPVEGQDFRIINLMDKASYLQPITSMKNTLLIYILVCLLAGGGIAWYLARRNYSPVKELVAMAEKVSNEKGGSNDFERIRSSMERLSKDYNTYLSMEKQRAEQTKLAILSRFLQDRCFGRVEQMNAFYILDSNFEEEEMLLLTFEVEPEEEAEEEENQAITLETLELPYFVVKNITEELLGEKYQMMMLECQGLAVCLIGMPKGVGSLDRAAALADIRRVAERVCSYTREYFHYSIVSDISGVHRRGEELQQAYAEIQELVGYRDTVGSTLAVIEYSSFRESQEKSELVKPELPKNEMEYTRIQPEALMKEVVAYIEKHYDDKNLTVSFLADQMGLGLSNLSQMFKRYQGTGLLEFINQIRLERAKELLLTGKTVKETAELVGFWTTRPLTNLFNQIEGMTPAAWKNQHMERREKA